MSDIELLKKAKEIISKPENWIQNAFARDADGDIVSSNSPMATCFCSIGALKNAWISGDDTFTKAVYYSALDRLNIKTKGVGMTVARYNDQEGRVHADIMKLFDDAINDE